MLPRNQRRVITLVNGKSEVAVQDPLSSLKLGEEAERLEAVAGIRKGLEEVARGKTRPAGEVFASLRKRHKISRG